MKHDTQVGSQISTRREMRMLTCAGVALCAVSIVGFAFLRYPSASQETKPPSTGSEQLLTEPGDETGAAADSASVLTEQQLFATGCRSLRRRFHAGRGRRLLHHNCK